MGGGGEALQHKKQECIRNGLWLLWQFYMTHLFPSSAQKQSWRFVGSVSKTTWIASESITSWSLQFYHLYQPLVLSVGEGNGSPLQCSCLENPRDGGAWWAAVCGVAQSWTRLKRLSSSSSPFCNSHWYKSLSFQLIYQVKSSFPGKLTPELQGP